MVATLFVVMTRFRLLLSPFHLAIPVHDLALAKNFYGSILGLKEGRSSHRWQDYNCFGHQLVCHEVEGVFRIMST